MLIYVSQLWHFALRVSIKLAHLCEMKGYDSIEHLGGFSFFLSSFFNKQRVTVSLKAEICFALWWFQPSRSCRGQVKADYKMESKAGFTWHGWLGELALKHNLAIFLNILLERSHASFETVFPPSINLNQVERKKYSSENVGLFLSLCTHPYISWLINLNLAHFVFVCLVP